MADRPSVRSDHLLPVLLALVALQTLVGTVSANAGPVEWSRSVYGGTLVPSTSSQVAVLREHLLIDFAHRVGWGVPIAASYRLHNETQQLQSFMVAFPVWVQEGLETVMNYG